MEKAISFSFLLMASLSLAAQTTAGFENFGLPAGAFLNGSDGSGGFSSGNAFLPNDYDPDFESWEPWAISATTDTQTPGFLNQYSATPGGGAAGSLTYAVAYCFSGCTINLQGPAAGGLVEGLYLTNSTYAYFSMLNGDPFSKKFGGETGGDPDFFRLTIKKFLNGEPGPDSVDFYLADYRFTDNSQDYIIDGWAYVDLRTLGNADSLWFRLSSSDIGVFGMNTPAYFCMDNLTTTDVTTAAPEPSSAPGCKAFPNPTTGLLRLSGPEPPRWITVHNSQGQLMGRPKAADNAVDLSGLPAGLYFVRLGYGEKRSVLHKVVKTE